MKNEIKFPLIVQMTFILFFLLLSYYMLTEFKNYLAPLTLGVLFAYLLFPLANFFESHRIPRILSNILSIIIGLSVIYGISFFIYKQFGVFLEDVPMLKERASSNIRTIFKSIEVFFGIETGEIKPKVNQFVQDMLNTSGQDYKSTFGATFHTLFTIFIMPVYIFFLLFYRDKFKEVILMLVPSNRHAVADRIINDINQLTVRYMTGIFIVVSILVVLNSLGFLIIGLDHAILLGSIAAVLNFIPYYGTIIGYAFPLLFSVFIMDSPVYVVLVLVQFVVVQFTENNILTPNIVGFQVNINPFMIILAITLGGFVWGLTGMFIAVPFVAALRVLGDNIDELAPLGYLLGKGGTEEHSVNVARYARFFKLSEIRARKTLRRMRKK
ncbi:MAG: AI-2E family transporter [Bacteroidetes bacterium]|nr:MAG: AI-2E family transporter [Bacteroidota bacterium]